MLKKGSVSFDHKNDIVNKLPNTITDTTGQKFASITMAKKSSDLERGISPLQIPSSKYPDKASNDSKLESSITESAKGNSVERLKKTNAIMRALTKKMNKSPGATTE